MLLISAGSENMHRIRACYNSYSSCKAAFSVGHSCTLCRGSVSPDVLRSKDKAYPVDSAQVHRAAIRDDEFGATTRNQRQSDRRVTADYYKIRSDFYYTAILLREERRENFCRIC